MADASPPRKSSRDVARRAAKGDVGARLDCWPILDVERSLEKIQLQGSEISLLSWLRRPNVNKAEVVKEILEHMSDRAEEHAMWMALVWRYAKEHEVWRHCQNPVWRTEDTFLDSLDGHQTVRICIQFGTSTDVARRGKMNIICRNWGEDWYQAALARALLPQEERGAAGLSKRLLGSIAEMSSVVDLDQALDLWDNAIRARTAVGSREHVGWKAATTTHLLPSDLTQQLVETHGMVNGRGRKQAQSLDASDEILELRSSAGYSSMSPFGARTQTFKSAASATPRSKGRQSNKTRTLDKKDASKQSEMKKALGDQRQQPNQPQGASPQRLQRDEDGLESDHSHQEQGEEDEGNEDDGHVENGENCRKERNENERVSDGKFAASIADTEVGTEKRSSSQVVEKVLGQRRKKARIGEANIGGQTTNSTGDILSRPVAIGTSPSIRVVRDQASGALLSANIAHNAKLDSVAEHPLHIRTQAKEGEAANTETFLPSCGPPSRKDRNEAGGSAKRLEGLASPSSTASSTDGFVETVANGSVFNLLDQASPPTDSQQACLLCRGVCSLCEVPATIDNLQQGRMYESAHNAHELEKKARDHTLRKWIRRIRYASQNLGLLGGQGEVCVLSAQSFKSQTKKGRLLNIPVIIKEDFTDSGEWTPARYAGLLDSVFADFDIDVRWHQDPEPKSVAVSEMAELCRGQLGSTLSDNPPNLLNISDIAGAATPSFLRMDRFRLLDLIVERCKAKPRDRVGKQLEITPFDVASNRIFNLLAWPGAFSGAHVDRDGATWVRNLFGYKLWMFVPENSMTMEDWDQLAEDSDKWDPGDKARAVVLCPGDVFVMRAGLVHAVQTLGDSGPCLMTGGSFWDDRDLLHTLRMQFWTGKNQSATNEPLSYQLAQLVDALEDMIRQCPSKFSTGETSSRELMKIIVELRSFGCLCEDRCDDNDCKCSREGRRCTPFCLRHASATTVLKRCMMEERANGESVNGIEEQDEDYVGSD